MGRPIHKKYFGNRNIGTASTTDNGIGGEGVASFGTIVAGSGSTTDQDAYVSAPNIPGGVTATIQAHYKALSLSTTGNGAGYNFGDLVEVTTGTATTKARATVSAITAMIAEVNAPGDGYAVGDVLVYSTGFASNVTVTVTSISDPDVNGFGPITGISLTAPGQRTSVAPTNPVAHDNVLGGSGCTVNFTWGAYSFSAPTVAGDYTVFPGVGGAGQLTTITGTGSLATADITLGLLSVTVLTRGSGYTTPADAALLFDGSANGASAVAVLTTDSGNVGSLTNQENAIVIYANTSNIGTTALVGDIIKQSSARRYKVETDDGIKVCKLGTDDTPAPGGAYIVATAASGGTYYVTKLTSHRATLAAKTGDDALHGEQVQWTFGAPSGSIVQIENA